MATFSPTDAALEGFRIAREKPRTMLIWAGVNLVLSLVMGVGLIALFGPMLAELEAVAAGGSQDSAQTLAMFERLAPLYALMIPAGLLVMAVTSAAVYRVILRPSESAYGYLRLGRDELRLALLILIYTALAIVFIFAVTLAAGLLAQGAGNLGGVGALLGVLIGLGAVAYIIFVSVRMSLAGPMTFAERRLRVFESWTLTRGNFWRLLGAYVLSLILALIVALLALIIYFAVAAITAGGDLASVGKVFQPDTTSLGSYFTPGMIIYLVFAAFLGAIQNAVVYSPGAVAYRDLTGTQPG